ncbi:MAG: outer membrane beta-barrel protein [Sulfurimonas sp.]|jgi:opacity protein-like surface antigen
MKKVLSLVATVAVLGSSVFAMDKSLYVGGQSVTLNKNQGVVGVVGYHADGRWDNGFLLGVSGEMGGGQIKFDNTIVDATATTPTTDITTLVLGTDLKIGYTLLKKLDIYATGGFVLQSLENDTGYGLGFGGGVSYTFTEKWNVRAEYKSYSMTTTASGGNASYDYATTGLSVGYRF